MEKTKAPVFMLSVVAIILVVTLYKQFDFETFKFEKPGLAILYSIVFIVAIYILVKNFNRKQ